MMGYGRELGYGYGNMMGGGAFGGFLMFILGALVIAGIVLLVVWALRASSGHHAGNASSVGQTGPPAAMGHHEAVAIAKRRLASGEITPEQYDEIMRALGG